MINDKVRAKVLDIWNAYANSNRATTDTKGKLFPDINSDRREAIGDIKLLIDGFRKGSLSVYEFKTAIDSYNKRRNLWGFTATKGQMFFNQLVKSGEHNIEQLTTMLKQLIAEPKNIGDALEKIGTLETFADSYFSKAPDKRKAPNPGSSSYFLSYFWQIQNHIAWPILYTSLINSFKELGIWVDHRTCKEDYDFFYSLNEEVKRIIREHSKQDVTNWDAEHAFWNYSGNPNQVQVVKEKKEVIVVSEPQEETTVTATFDLNDYIIPRVAKLVELGASTDKPGALKGSQYEKMVAEVFRQLDFEVDNHGQGSGREPDAIARYREDSTAFIIDAKAYSNGYTLGTDDRAIKEYVNRHIPKLQKNGIRKVGFIIVSNSFRSNFDSFTNDITWNTDVKRFMLMTSEALLYLLAYKTKDKLSLSDIVDAIVGMGNPITAQNVIDKFDDI